jgi:uncharacterized protein YjbI with pentapeptide repeats
VKVIKPTKLGVLARSFEHERRFHLGVSVFAFVPLVTEGRAPLLSEVAMWKLVAERMGQQAMLDAGVPKSRGEYLVHGTCYSPGGIPRAMVPVRARVGTLEKALAVHGDRFWKPGRAISEEQRFTTMPLDWTRAFGGPRFKRNPLGRGHGESDYMGQRVQLLPNIESPQAPVASPGDKPEPAGFGPLDPAWPQRRELAGTYDEQWLRTLFPGMAADVDWRFFNLAAPDQQREGFWEGDEDWRFENMHPTRQRLEGTLPGLVARAFVARRAEAEAAQAASEGSQGPVETVETVETVQLEEVELALRTLWFFPDAERAVLVYQGSVTTAEDDAADVLHLVIAGEHREEPRPVEHYAAALEARLDPEQGAIAVLRDHELLPAGMAETAKHEVDDEQALHQTERRLEHNLHRRALREHQRTVEQLVALGLDPNAFAPEPPKPPPPAPSPDELPALVQQLQADAIAMQDREEAELRERQAALAKKLEVLGFSEEDRERLLHQHEKGPTGPPSFTAAGQQAMVHDLVERTRAAGAPTEDLERMLSEPGVVARWVEAETQLRDNYRRTAHLQDPAPALTVARSQEARACVRESLATRVDFSTLDLTGADLGSMELQGSDLRGAFFESTRLDGADLRGADLAGAVLAHASLRGAKLDGARLAGANLGRATLTGASLVGADLTGAELMGTDLTGAVLRGADLRGASFMQTKLTDADCSEVRTEQLVLVQAEVTGLRLSGASLVRATFVQLDLTGADFSRAELESATFLECKAPGVSFAGARLDGARFVKACDLAGAVLAGASLRACNLRGTSMPGADLGHARLDDADLSECVLRAASFVRAVARGARFDKADLTDASFVTADLMRASFMNATIRGVDLRGTNLYGADMARVRSDAHVRLDEAVLTKVRVHPLHSPQGSRGPQGSPGPGGSR